MTREDFITASEIALEKLLKPLEGLSEELMNDPLTEGKWSVKQTLSHLIYWNTLVVQGIELLYRGEEFDWSAYDDEDDFNATVTTLNREEPYPRVLSQLRIVHSTVIAAIERVPPERLDADGNLPDWLPQRFPEHYLRHAPAIKEWATRIRESGRGGAVGLPVIN